MVKPLSSLPERSRARLYSLQTRRTRRATVLLLLFLGQIAGLILLTEQQARAYVDPGSGLLLLQMLGASLAGVFYALRHKLARRFGRSSSRTPPDEQPTPPASDSSSEGNSRQQT